MWKIFLNDRSNVKEALSVSVAFITPAIYSVYWAVKDMGKPSVVFLVSLVLSIFFVTLMAPTVPKGLFLMPLDQKQRERYVKRVYWLRIIICNILNLAAIIVARIYYSVAIPNLIVEGILCFVISFLFCLLDYVSYYKEIGDGQKALIICVAFVMAFLYIIMINVEPGDGNIFRYIMIGFTVLGAVYDGYIYHKYYNHMIEVYADSEKYYLRTSLINKKRKQWNLH